MEINIDMRVFRGLITKLDHAVDVAQREIDRIGKKYNKLVYKGLDKIARNAITSFYDDYTPKRYLRRRDLYNSYRITATNEDWYISLGSEYMEKDHSGGSINQDGEKEGKPISNEYIYKQTMIMGSHGGAWRKRKKDYYWRMPYPDYTKWWPSPTPKYHPKGGANIEDVILNDSNKFLKYMEIEREKEFKQKMQPALDAVRDSINRLKK